MATSDKHSQTLHAKDNIHAKSGKITEITADPEAYARAMYDDTVAVDAPEVSSPSSDDEEKPVPKFRPPPRQTARHDFGSATESESDDDFLGQVEEMQPPAPTAQQRAEPPRRVEPVPARDAVRLASRPSSRTTPRSAAASTDNSDSDSGAATAAPARRRPTVVIPAEGAYDPADFRDLQVPPDLDEVFQYITKYTPQKVDIEFKLAPFVPDYVPAVGDIDACLKVAAPAAGPRGRPLSDELLDHIDNLGLAVLDEPAAEQSDSALLQLQIRARSRSAARATVLTKKVDSAERRGEVVRRWVRDVSALHATKPPPNVVYTRRMPDIDALMEEWPAGVEAALAAAAVPPPHLDCTLPQYADLLCALFDVPVGDGGVNDRAPVGGGGVNDRVQSLHVLFTLYAAVKGTQLYADRERERADAM